MYGSVAASEDADFLLASAFAGTEAEAFSVGLLVQPKYLFRSLWMVLNEIYTTDISFESLQYMPFVHNLSTMDLSKRNASLNELAFASASCRN